MNGHMNNNSIGELIDAKLSSEGVTLPKGVTLRLTGFTVDNAVSGMVTVDATMQQSGTIIVGPDARSAGIGNDDQLMRGCRAYRWTLNPIRMRNPRSDKPWERNFIKFRPSIVQESLLDLTCPMCQMSRIKMSREDIFKVSVGPDGKSARRYLPNNRVLCQTCADNPGVGSAVYMIQRRRHMSMFPIKSGLTDPAFQNQEDPSLLYLMDAWMMDPSTVDNTILPRIWAVYPMGRAPTDWLPEDPLSAEIESKYNAVLGIGDKPNPMTIRPFSHVVKTQEKGVASACVSMVMEAKSHMRTGWVDESKLYENNDSGFKMRFITQRVNSLV